MKISVISIFCLLLFSCSGFFQYRKCANEYSISLEKSQYLFEGYFLYKDSLYFKDYYKNNSIEGEYVSTLSIDTTAVLNQLLIFYSNGRFAGPIYYSSNESINELVQLNSDKIYSFSSLGRYILKNDTVLVEYIQIDSEKAPFIKYDMKKAKYFIDNKQGLEKIIEGYINIKKAKTNEFIRLDEIDAKIDTNKFWNFNFESRLEK